MRRSLGIAGGIAAAALIHVGFLLFGGLLFFKPPAEAVKKVEVVDLLSETEAEKDKDKKQEQKVEQQAEAEEPEQEAIETPDQMPDLSELSKLDAAATAPALEAVSLSAMEDLLNANGSAGGDFFTGGADIASGGRIGGMGKAIGDSVESVFAIGDLDQKPRPIVQSPPSYPFELRRKKIEGSVSVYFVVDEDGRVVDPRVERATDPAFERPALEAVRQWRFEPAVRGGQKVKAKMHVPLRFSVS